MNSHHIISASKNISNAIADLNKNLKFSPLHEIIIAMSEYDEFGNYTLGSTNLDYNNKSLFSILKHCQNAFENNQFMPWKSDVYFSIKEGMKFYKQSNYRFKSIQDEFTDKMYSAKLYDFFVLYVFVANLVPVEIHNIECYKIEFDRLLEYSKLMQGRESIRQFMRSLGDQANNERREELMEVMQNSIVDSPVYISDEEGTQVHISYLVKNYDYQRVANFLIGWLCKEENYTMEINNV